MCRATSPSGLLHLHVEHFVLVFAWGRSCSIRLKCDGRRSCFSLALLGRFVVQFLCDSRNQLSVNLSPLTRFEGPKSVKGSEGGLRCEAGVQASLISWV